MNRQRVYISGRTGGRSPTPRGIRPNPTIKTKWNTVSCWPIATTTGTTFRAPHQSGTSVNYRSDRSEDFRNIDNTASYTEAFHVTVYSTFATHPAYITIVESTGLMQQ